MTYELEISERLQKIFEKLKKKDKVRADILKRKIKEILENPFIGKPLTGDMAGIRRIHIRPFVLSYEILEKGNIVRLLDYDHHDNIYR
tara:strand:- start:36 stop:299 length:264 start_codon:yes stop_codon:yes gene_type:complete